MSGPIAYTDGSCLGNPGPGGWGVRIIYPDRTVMEFGGVQSNTTNNRMEMQAVIAALDHLSARTEMVVRNPLAESVPEKMSRSVDTQPQLTVCSDSRYVLDGLTKWLPAWKRRGWVTASGHPVKNRPLWQQLDKLMHSGIALQHVRGHSGDPNNERVDDIARAFASGESPLLFQGQLGDRDDPVTEAPLQGARDRLPGASRTPSRPRSRQGGQSQYVSIIKGRVAVDADWPTCAARVKGVSGARYKKVRTPQELAEFCAEHGVDVPLGF